MLTHTVPSPNNLLHSHELSPDTLQVHTERVDDLVLLLGVMMQMELPQLLDRHIPSHWKQRALSWGWTATIWLAYVLSAGDHRKVAVREYVKTHLHTLEVTTGQTLSDLDFTDDRLGIVLKHLQNPDYWSAIETDLNHRTIRLYQLNTDVVRCDATTASGHHAVAEEGLFQFGHSKDDPTLPQIKLMTGALDPLGMPLATDVVSGEHSDDRLYIPVINRLYAALRRSGVLYVGDCKLSAFETRVHIKSLSGYYLSPLPQTGVPADELAQWIQDGIALSRQDTLHPVMVDTTRKEAMVAAVGYERERQQTGQIAGKACTIRERVLMVKSFAHATRQAYGLEQRLAHAEQQLTALTPPRGRGKRQITDETNMQAAIERIVQTHRVDGLLSVSYAREVAQKRPSHGRGNGGVKRSRTVTERGRYQVTDIARDTGKIARLKETFGWRAYVTNAPRESLSLEQAVRLYRQEYRIERIFHRLKSRLNIVPMFVQTPEQVTGLTHFLMLGVRVLTLVEFVVRRSLERDQATLTGLYPENPLKSTATPTCERVFTAFRGITLTTMSVNGQIVAHLTPLSDLQQEILQRLDLNTTLYEKLTAPGAIRRRRHLRVSVRERPEGNLCEPPETKGVSHTEDYACL